MDMATVSDTAARRTRTPPRGAARQAPSDSPHARALDRPRPAVPDRDSPVLALLHAPTRAARRARRRLAWASRHAVDLDAGSPSNSHAPPGAAFRAPSAS